MSARWTPPRQIDELRVERLLGRGAMAGVWLARDTLLERDVALKIAEGPQTAETRQRLRMEARAVGRLQHPNIVAVHRAGEIDDRPFLVTELLGGKSLDLVRLPLPTERVLGIGADLARGLAAAHAAGVLHRDVKPGNAFLCDDGSAKLLDFGLAQLRVGSVPPPAFAGSPGPPVPEESETYVGGALAATQAASMSSAGLAGTPLYMAPETWRGEAATRRTDVYSLGAMLYELLTGSPPYVGETLRELRTAVLEGSVESVVAPPSTPLAAVVEIVMRCLQREPQGRPSADEVCHALEALGAASMVEPTSGRSASNPYRGLRAFEPEHRALFFGREAEAAAVVAELRVAGLVLVVGPSGAGKSSLVRAGVVPQVSSGALGPRTRAVIMVPGAHPVERLAQALAPALGVAEGQVAHSLFDTPSWAAERLCGRPTGERLVLVLDQLEEAWTLSDPAQRAAFFDAIGALTRARPLARVVATLRSDFLSRLEDLGDLRGEALRAAVVLGPLSKEGLRRAIVEPALRRGVKLEPALVDHLVEAALAHAVGALPLLEFALAALWDRRDPSSGVLGLADLEALGGLEGALAAHADSALARMTSARREEARRVLLDLVTLERTRARRERGELDLSTPDAVAAIEALVDARIVVASAGEAGASYEIAHEALVSEWPALRAWLDEEAGAREVEARLERAAAEWERLGAGTDGLLGDRRLEELRVLDGRPLTARDRAFVEASRAAVPRGRWRRRLLALGVPLVVALATTASWGVAVIRRGAAVAAVVAEARASYARAIEAGHRAEDLRAQALMAFERDDVGPAEELWRALQGREAEAAEARGAVLAVLDRGLSLDPRAPAVRSLYADVTYARIVASEGVHDTSLLPALRADLRLYDDGSRVARLSAPGVVRVESDPPGASVTVSRYRDRGDGHLVEDTPQPLASPTRQLDAGSYLLVATLPGRATARVPFVVERARERGLHVTLPPLSAVLPGMVYVPGGAFLYGSAEDEATRVFLTHQPMHEVDLPPYLVARTETSYGDYLEYLRASDARREARPTGGLELMPAGRARVILGGRVLAEGEDYCLAGRPCVDWRRLPVASVTRRDAADYAAWLARTGRLPGARLCSDREWELAARGADGRRFPWGDGDPVAGDACLTATRAAPLASGPCEVGSLPASQSPCGALDMTGNVWEWTGSTPDRATPSLGSQRGGGFADEGLLLALPNRGLVTIEGYDAETGIRICADLPRDAPNMLSPE